MKINPNIQPVPNLKAKFNLDQSGLHELVCHVMSGQIKEPSRYDLKMGLKRLLNEESETFDPASDDAEHRRRRCELLTLWVNELSGLPMPAGNQLAGAPGLREIMLGDCQPVTALISELAFTDYSDVARFLEVCVLPERNCVQFCGTENCLLANIPRWHGRISADFPAHVLRDEDARVMALFTVTQETPGIGSLGICTQEDCPVHVLEKIIELAATLARSRFGVLQSAMSASRARTASAFNNAGFEHTLMKGIQPDGAGGIGDRIIFYKRLRCDEEYSSAGD